MRIEEFVEEQRLLASAFGAWWRVNHDNAVGVEEEGMDADEMWPMEMGSGEYDESLFMFDLHEISKLEPELQEQVFALMPADDAEKLREWLGPRQEETPEP